jgi:hypothetical protein
MGRKSESGRGPNEICSALLKFLEQLEECVKNEDNPPKILTLSSDLCSAQNKNLLTIATSLYYVNCRQIYFQLGGIVIYPVIKYLDVLKNASVKKKLLYLLMNTTIHLGTLQNFI